MVSQRLQRRGADQTEGGGYNIITHRSECWQDEADKQACVCGIFKLCKFLEVTWFTHQELWAQVVRLIYHYILGTPYQIMGLVYVHVCMCVHFSDRDNEDQCHNSYVQKFESLDETFAGQKPL